MLLVKKMERYNGPIRRVERAVKGEAGTEGYIWVKKFDSYTNYVDDECNFANSDNISKSGYSNGSDGEQQSTINNNDRDNKDDSKQVTNDTKPLYEDELEKHGQSDTVAMDVQLIKGVLPDLFAVLKFLESDNDLVFDGIICHYFLKKLQVAESKKLEWWKRNCNAVQKSIDGRQASVSNLIKKHSWVCIQKHFNK